MNPNEGDDEGGGGGGNKKHAAAVAECVCFCVCETDGELQSADRPSMLPGCQIIFGNL